ncbi:hypothetical protein ACYZTR_26160 [Pseudomonas sp. Hz4]
MNNTGGGSATNSGVDFQQRVAAFFVLSMGLSLDCSIALGHHKQLKIKKISFETSDSIDDIKLIHKKSITYIQAKRQLSLSEAPTSDFFKTIEQFYKQNRSSQNPKDSYTLVTTADSSKKITKELKKITKSLRLNVDALTENPLSQSEQETLQKVSNIVKLIASNNKHQKVSDVEFIELLKKIHIITLDLEQGGTYESAFLTSITCQLSIHPELLWNYIITKSLDWSKNRQSIDNSETKSLLDNFIKPPQTAPLQSDTNFHFAFDAEKFKICSGREVILIESPNKKNEVVLLELKRFNDAGEFLLSFQEDKVELQDGSKYKLYGRAATISGAARLFHEDPRFMKKNLILPDAESISAIDNELIPLAYSEKIRSSITSNTNVSKCIHCGDGLSHNGMFVEIQETSLPFDNGIIHKKCRRPSDRILGTGSNPGIDLYPELKNFDYKKWFTLLPESQAVWGSLENISTKATHILWTPDQEHLVGTHCIKATLEDSSTRYIQHRGQIQRFTSENADIECSRFIEQARAAQESGNPLCFSSDGDVFSNKDTIMRNQQTPAKPIECLNFEKAVYTRGLSALHDTCKNYYAPLTTIMDERNNPILFKDMVFLISRPIDLKHFLENWKAIASTVENYKLNIIEDDKQFDHFMHKLRAKKISVLVDPIFDRHGELLSGSTISHMDDLINNKN